MSIITPGTLAEPDLAPSDVESYTNGLLGATDPETQRMLDVALTAARRDVRWHVSPVLTGETISVDGPGGNRLRLPTSAMWSNTITLNAVTSDGVSVDPVNDVTVSADTPNLLIKNSGLWSHAYSGVTIGWDHGFEVDRAADWRQAVLALVVSIAEIAVAGRPNYELASQEIDDVAYRWGANASLGSIEPILAKYRLLWRWI